jgi:hypothetical protein
VQELCGLFRYQSEPESSRRTIQITTLSLYLSCDIQ